MPRLAPVTRATDPSIVLAFMVLVFRRWCGMDPWWRPSRLGRGEPGGEPSEELRPPGLSVLGPQFQLSILTSIGSGVPFPVSRSDFRLITKSAHLVLQ